MHFLIEQLLDKMHDVERCERHLQEIKDVYNAYAFSIDDKQVFLSVPGDELVITIGGPTGLPDGFKQRKLPTAGTIHESCH